MNKPLALIVGVGAATGRAVCEKLAADYTLAMVARRGEVIDALAETLPDAHAYRCDVTDRPAWAELLVRIRATLGQPTRILMNTEKALWGRYQSLSLDDFSDSFSVNVVSLLQTVQVLFPDAGDIPAGSRLIITSSPAAYNPPPTFVGLAPSRVAQRALAELLHANLAEHGLAFSVFAIDGAIDEPNMRSLMPDKPTEYFIAPELIAGEIASLFSAVELPLASGISGASSFANR